MVMTGFTAGSPVPGSPTAPDRRLLDRLHSAGFDDDEEDEDGEPSRAEPSRADRNRVGEREGKKFDDSIARRGRVVCTRVCTTSQTAVQD